MIILLLTAIVLFTSCDKEDKEPDPVTVAEFLGNYSIGEGSYRVLLDTNGTPIASEQASIAGETMNVRLGNGDTLIITSPTLGVIKVLPSVSGQQVNLAMPEQPYNGSLNVTGGDATLRTSEQFHFKKESDGKKFINSNSGNGIIMFTMRAGNKYQVSIRRTGLT